VAFVAPWCDFSKALLPEVDRVAEAFEGEAYVAVATVDGEKWDALAQRCVVVVPRGWLVLYSLLCARHARARASLTYYHYYYCYSPPPTRPVPPLVSYYW